MAASRNPKPKKVVAKRAGSKQQQAGTSDDSSFEDANVSVMGMTPATAEGNLMISTTHALSNQAQDMTSVSQGSDLMLHVSTIENLKILFK